MDINDAFTQINNQLNIISTNLIDDGVIDDILWGGKRRPILNFPCLGIAPGKLKYKDDDFGSTGNLEQWTYPIQISGMVNELNNPLNGFNGAVNVVSQARNLILVDRQLGLPKLVRKIDSSEIEPVPAAIPYKNYNIYQANATFNFTILINNISGEDDLDGVEHMNNMKNQFFGGKK